MRVGTFAVKSGKLMVTDPCYKRGTWCQGILDNVAKGSWSASVKYCKDEIFPKGGDRVAQLVVTFGKEPVGEWDKQNICVGVDSGQAGVFDESLYPDDPRSEEGEKNFYDPIGEFTLGKVQAGTISFGAVSQAGYGDGSYDCFTKSRRGKIVAVKIEFIGPDEDEDLGDDDDDSDDESGPIAD